MKTMIGTSLLAGLLVAGMAWAGVVVSGEGTFDALETENPLSAKLTVTDGDRSVALEAMGSGIRKKLTFKVYEVVLYFADGAALPPDPYPALVQGNLPKRIEMHFLRDVDHGKIMEAWEDAMKNANREGGLTPEAQTNQATFMGYFSERDLASGQIITLTWLPGTGLITTIGSSEFEPIDDLSLTSALFAVWLGDHPISEELKKDLLRLRAGE